MFETQISQRFCLKKTKTKQPKPAQSPLLKKVCTNRLSIDFTLTDLCSGHRSIEFAGKPDHSFSYGSLWKGVLV